MVAAPEGVAMLQRDHPEVPIIAGALDRELNEVRVHPAGLGDFGDRLHGTTELSEIAVDATSARSRPRTLLPAAAGGRTFPTNPASTTIVTMYGVMRTNSGGISRRIGASASR